MAVKPMTITGGSKNSTSRASKSSSEEKFCHRLDEAITFLNYLSSKLIISSPKNMTEYKICLSETEQQVMKKFGYESKAKLRSLFPDMRFNINDREVYVFFRLKYVKVGCVYVSYDDTNTIIKGDDGSNVCYGSINDAIDFYTVLKDQMNDTNSVGYAWYDCLRKRKDIFTHKNGRSPVTQGNSFLALPAPTDDVIDADYEEA
ncbi:hypothetical protein KBX73_03050 [Acetobacter persici]|uniref:hypothetical protein n=1 Tax=Acetobacter persici TaxID=1076596 RepID=UPI0020CDC1FE|nr:hypothetical protein [Acetobacter persici]MCP9318769.1 hypothetical protein [Acetobacter persici]